MRHNSSANALLRASVSLLLAAVLAACAPSGPALPAGVTLAVVAETPTPLRYPTLPPEWTSTWTPAPTIPVAAPTGTTAPAQTPVPPTPSAAPPAKRTACDHPYLPLRQGAHWDYQMQAGPMSWTVTDITGDMNNAAATVVVKFPTSTSTYHFFCDAAGLRTYDFDFNVVDTNGVQEDPAVLSSAGVFMPPASFLDTATLFANWKEVFIVNYGPGPNITRTAELATTYENIGPVSVPAGDFDATRISWDGRSQTFQPGDTGQHLQYGSGLLWMVKDVGIVRFSPPADDQTARLVSYFLPAEVTVTAEPTDPLAPASTNTPTIAQVVQTMQTTDLSATEAPTAVHVVIGRDRIVPVLLQAGFVLGPDDPAHDCVKPCLNYRQPTSFQVARLLPDGTFILDYLPSHPDQVQVFVQIIDALYPQDVLVTIDKVLNSTVPGGSTEDSVDGYYIVGSLSPTLDNKIVVSIR